MKMRLKILKDVLMQNKFGYAKIKLTKGSEIDVEPEMALYLIEMHWAKDITRR